MEQACAFDDETVAAFQPAEKIGLVATINPQGLPHITLITSIRACGPRRLTLGEFCKGLSKTHVRMNPRTGFLVMTLDRSLWRGTAHWTHLRHDGPEYDGYNDLPMFRYNTYFGIHTVHYLDLRTTSARQALPVRRIMRAALITRLAKGGAAGGSAERILKPFGQMLFNRLDALKFLAYVAPDGYPCIVPVLQCQAADSGRLVFALHAFGDELEAIAPGTIVAVYGLTMAMENVLVRGTFHGLQRCRTVRLARIDIDWVYNSMPPIPGQIYPPVRLNAISEF